MPRDYAGNEIHGEYVHSDYSGVVALRYATGDVQCVLCDNPVPETGDAQSPHAWGFCSPECMAAWKTNET